MAVGVSEIYFIPYGIALGASPAQVALLATAPNLAGTILQTQSASLTQRIGSRTKLVNVCVFLHVLAWIPILAIPYVVPDPELRPWALLAAMTLFSCAGLFSVPAWQSLMTDYVPVSKRGRYFGWRNRVQGVLMVGTALVAGFTLHRFGKDAITGFAWVFSFAMLCRFFAWFCLTRMAEPFRKTSHDVYFSFISFVRQFRTSNFARFVTFVALVSLSANLSGPLMSVFLLQDLRFDYATYTILMTTATLSGFLFQELWGKYGDLTGNIRVLRVATWGVALVPLLWMVSRAPAWLFFVQIGAGALWGGFNLLATNFVLEAVSPGKKIRATAYFNVVNCFAVFLGASLGGWLYHRMPPLAGYSYLSLFLLSCAARIAVVAFFSKRVRDVRGPRTV